MSRTDSAHQPMRQPTRRCPPVRALLLAIAATTASAGAMAEMPSGGTFVMRKQVVANGGNASSGNGVGGNYQLVATIAQNAAGPATGGDYVLQQGFHAATTPAPADALFNNSFESN